MRGFIQNKIADSMGQDSLINPVIGIGVPVRTADVLNLDLKENPWFMAITGLNQMRLDQLKKDAIVTGYSVVTRSPSAERRPKTIIGLKIVDSLTGGEAGKLQGGVGPSTFAELAYADKRSPSIQGFTTIVHMPLQEEVGVPQNGGPKEVIGSTSSSKKETNKKDRSSARGVLTLDVSPDTGKPTESLYTPTSATFQNIRTGGLYFDHSTLSSVGTMGELGK